jgi:hypothetical protein
MERRNFLKFAAGLAAGAGVLAAASANAAPLLASQSRMTGPLPEPKMSAESAVVDQNEVERLQPEQVQWRRRHWHRNRWHGGRRHWHRRRW